MLLDSEKAQCCLLGWVDYLDDKYEAVMFLVEKGKKEGFLPFKVDNLNKIYENNLENS